MQQLPESLKNSFNSACCYFFLLHLFACMNGRPQLPFLFLPCSQAWAEAFLCIGVSCICCSQCCLSEAGWNW